MIKHVKFINIVLFIYSWMPCLGKFIYCLQNGQSKKSDECFLDHGIDSIRTKMTTTELITYLGNRNWFVTHKKMNNHETGAVMPMCTVDKYTLRWVSSMGEKLWYLLKITKISDIFVLFINSSPNNDATWIQEKKKAFNFLMGPVNFS